MPKRSKSVRGGWTPTFEQQVAIANELSVGLNEVRAGNPSDPWASLPAELRVPQNGAFSLRAYAIIKPYAELKYKKGAAQYFAALAQRLKNANFTPSQAKAYLDRVLRLVFTTGKDLAQASAALQNTIATTYQMYRANQANRNVINGREKFRSTICEGSVQNARVGMAPLSRGLNLTEAQKAELQTLDRLVKISPFCDNTFVSANLASNQEVEQRILFGTTPLEEQDVLRQEVANLDQGFMEIDEEESMVDLVDYEERQAELAALGYTVPPEGGRGKRKTTRKTSRKHSRKY